MMRLDDARLLDCLDLLLGAVWADGDYSEGKRAAIEGLAARLAAGDTLTAEARLHLARFDPLRFDPSITCARLGLAPGPDAIATRRRRAFIGLFGHVFDANRQIGDSEASYIDRILGQIGFHVIDARHAIEDFGEIAVLLASPPDKSAQAGRVLGKRYELARARRGGLDGRFIAYDRPLGARRVEIRRLNPHVAPEDAPRLLREAVAVGATGSPHVAAVYDVGGLSDNTPYVVTEPLRGETLATRLDRLGKLAPDDALRIADAMLAGLEAVHAAGVIHRALSADDVFLVTTIGVEDHVKLTGFGTTRLAHVEPTDGHAVIGVGSPIAPERLGGAPVDERADLFSAAALIFQMFTGRPPYGDDTPPSLLAVRATSARRPPRLADVDESLAALDAVLGANLSLDPEDRLADAGEFRAALEEAAMELG